MSGGAAPGGAALGCGRARWGSVLGGAEGAGERDEALPARSDTEGLELYDEDREGLLRLALCCGGCGESSWDRLRLPPEVANRPQGDL